MRIINADKVLDILNELDNHSLDGKMYINNAIHLIEKQPTIYNIDKVIEELEEERQRWIDDINYIETLDDNNENARAKAKAQGYSGAYFNAIEIVKQGGVSDDCCEWKRRTDNDSFLYTSCNNRVNAYSDEFKYCPWCRKEIKVVE